MNTSIVEVSKGRQITLPKTVRNKLHLIPGSKLEVIERDHELVLKPLGDDLKHLFERAHSMRPRRKLTPEQMDQVNEGLFT